MNLNFVTYLKNKASAVCTRLSEEQLSFIAEFRVNNFPFLGEQMSLPQTEESQSEVQT